MSRKSSVKMTPLGEFRDIQNPNMLVESFKQADPDGWVLGDEESIRNPCAQAVIGFPATARRSGQIVEGTTDYTNRVRNARHGEHLCT